MNRACLCTQRSGSNIIEKVFAHEIIANYVCLSEAEKCNALKRYDNNPRLLNSCFIPKLANKNQDKKRGSGISISCKKPGYVYT